MTPDQYCQQKAVPAGSSFHYSLLFTDTPRRRALTALRALQCELTSVVRDTADETAARIKLAWWRTEIAALFKQNPQHLVTRALAPAITAYELPRQSLDDLVDGAEMDLLQTRYLDFIALERYCLLSGSAAVACVATICGGVDVQTEAFGRQLGLGLRLATMIRSVGEDARSGRVYLPVNELQQFNVPVADILNARSSDNFVRLMQFQSDRALRYLDQAGTELPNSQRKFQRPSLTLSAISRVLLNEIQADGFKVLKQRTSLTPIRKLWLAFKTRIDA
jgi:15-cis-phytoene synthase